MGMQKAPALSLTGASYMLLYILVSAGAAQPVGYYAFFTIGSLRSPICWRHMA